MKVKVARKERDDVDVSPSPAGCLALLAGLITTVGILWFLIVGVVALGLIGLLVWAVIELVVHFTASAATVLLVLALI